MAKLNCLIGDIIGGFVRTEFMLSQILSELDLRNHRIDFFANSQTGKKIKDILKELENSDISNRSDFIYLIDKLDKLREKRNIVVHSLVLTNSKDNDEYLFHNYNKKGDKILDKTTKFSTSDLEEIHTDIRDIHNKLYKLHYEKSS